MPIATETASRKIDTSRVEPRVKETDRKECPEPPVDETDDGPETAAHDRGED
jgi:hypothetical protein